jgi:hypothetical protein
MTLELSTPALLFPAISLLLLAYTNRFLHLAALIRQLHREHTKGSDPLAKPQIDNLRVRLELIRWMQALGIASLLCCTVAMGALFFGWAQTGSAVFSIGMVLMAASLAVALREIMISGGALKVYLGELGGEQKPK